MTQKKFSSQTGLLSFSATIIYFAHILQQAKAQDQLLGDNDNQAVALENECVSVAEEPTSTMNHINLSLIQDHHIQPVDLSASDLNDDSRTSEKSIATEDDHSGGSTLLFFAGAALVGSTVFINSGSDNNENNTVELTDLQTTPIVERASFIDFVLHDDFVTIPITLSSTDVNQVNLEMLSLSDASTAIITDRSTVQIYSLEGFDHTDMASQYTQSSQNESIESLLHWTADQGEYFSVHSLTDQTKAQLGHPAWSMFIVNLNDKGEYTTADAWGSSMALVSLDENSNVTIEPVAFDSVLTQHIQSGYSVAGVTASNAGVDVEVMMYSSEGVMRIPVVEGIESSLEDTDVATWTDILPQSTPQDVTVSVNDYGMVVTSLYQTSDDDLGTYYFQWCSLDDVQSAMNNDSSIQSMNSVSFTQGQELGSDSLQSFHRGALATVTSSDDQSSLVYLTSGDMQDPQGIDLSSSTVRGLVDSNFDQQPDTVLLEKNDSEIVTIVMLEDDVLQLDERSLSSSLYVPAIRPENISASDPFMIDLSITSDLKLVFDVAFITTRGDGGSVLSMDRLSEPQLSSSVAMNRIAPWQSPSSSDANLTDMALQNGSSVSLYNDAVLFRQYSTDPVSGATSTEFQEYPISESTPYKFINDNGVTAFGTSEAVQFSMESSEPESMILTPDASSVMQKSNQYAMLISGESSYWLAQNSESELANILYIDQGVVSLTRDKVIDISGVSEIMTHHSPANGSKLLIVFNEADGYGVTYTHFDSSSALSFEQQINQDKIIADNPLFALAISDNTAYLYDDKNAIYRLTTTADGQSELMALEGYEVGVDFTGCYALDIDGSGVDKLFFKYGDQGTNKIDLIQQDDNLLTKTYSLSTSGLVSDVLVEPWYQYDQSKMFIVVADSVVGQVAYLSNFLTHERMFSSIDSAWQDEVDLSLKSFFIDEAIKNPQLEMLLTSAVANVLNNDLDQPFNLSLINNNFIDQQGMSLATQAGEESLLDMINHDGPLATFAAIINLSEEETLAALTSYDGGLGF